MKHYEGHFSGIRDTKIFFQIWTPEAQAKAVVVITHGLGEHSGSYHRVVDALKTLPISILGWDLRGHGRSEGARGVTLDFLDHIHDLTLLLQHLRAMPEYSKLPLILLAHSMGGLIQLRYLCSEPNVLPIFQVLSAPYLGIAVAVHPIKDLGARWLKFLAPQLALDSGIKDDMVTRDPLVVEETNRDPLRHHRINSATYLGSLEAHEFVQTRADRLKIPSFFQIPRRDEVVSSAATISFFERMKISDKKMNIYENRKHECYNDLGREEVLDDLRAEIQKRTT